MIKSWIFEFFGAPPELAQHFDPVASQRHFNAYLDLWASAECAGFEGIFFSEHHFGTAAGIPQEMAQVGVGVDEARERYDESVEILDKALAEPVISHHGRYWNFDNLRITPRPIQQPWPPNWVTVVSTSSARKAAQRGARICTGFHPQTKVIEIFDAYRDEARKLGRDAGPDDLCIRRQVTLLDDDSRREETLVRRRHASRERLKADPRLDLPDRPAVLDTPTAHAFSIGDDEFMAGTPATVAEDIIAQCREAGAGHFAALFDRSMRPEQLKVWYRDYGAVAIPMLRDTTV